MLHVAAIAQPGNYINLSQKTEVLKNTMKSTVLFDVYYDKSRTSITKHYTSPEEYIITTNRLGELKIFYPETNSVVYKQSDEFATQRNLIYYFANNLTNNLGLIDEGFTLVSSEYEDEYRVSYWEPASSAHVVSKVKLVFRGSNPVYAEYNGRNGEVLKKIYYSKYQDYLSFRLPMNLVEIVYAPNGDSTINRTIISGVLVNDSPTSDYFNFKIPDDAVPHKTK
jgi:hypothetical protein